MKLQIKLLWTVLTMALVSRVNTVQAEDFYVAPDGKEGNPGTEEEPFGSVEQAQAAASAGDTVYIRGGEYKFSGTRRTVGVAFTKSGEPYRPIRYFAYPGEQPIFDLFELSPPGERVTGLDVHCNWIHIRGLEVTGVNQGTAGEDSWGVRIQGNHNVIENLNVHHCEAPGVFITRGASNLILNTDSHHNYDPKERGKARTALAATLLVATMSCAAVARGKTRTMGSISSTRRAPAPWRGPSPFAMDINQIPRNPLVMEPGSNQGALGIRQIYRPPVSPGTRCASTWRLAIGPRGSMPTGTPGESTF